MRFLVRPKFVHNIVPAACGIPLGGGVVYILEALICTLECKEKGGGGCSKHRTKENCKGYCNVCNDYCGKNR